jgi:hypothetical protein
MWEVKQAADSEGIGNRNNTFSWYDENQLDYSTPDGGQCNFAGPCDSQAYIERVNQSNLCGFNNWRLPDKLELQGLVDYGSAQPSVDRNFFPHAGIDFYWTSTVDTDDPGSVWSVGFNFGRVAGGSSAATRALRLVRRHRELVPPNYTLSDSEQDIVLRNEVAPGQRCLDRVNFTAPIERFKQDNQGHVLDTLTGLIWRRCVEGTSGEFCEQGEPLRLGWQAALEHAASESQTGLAADVGWRLPNIKELQSTNELACEEPPLNPFVFPNVHWESVWSSTPHAQLAGRSFHYQYQNGVIFYGEHSEEFSVHLVKDCR